MSATRRTYRSDVALTCAGCKAQIAPGEPHWQGLTKEPWHKACRRLGVTQSLYTPGRYKADNPTGKPCEGCDQEITAEDDVVFKVARPWHKECAKR